MPYDPDKHHRRSVRLKGYDYSSPGTYFVTICTHQRRMLFGEIVDGNMYTNDIGDAVRWIWNTLPDSFAFLRLDTYVIMPNHLHAMLHFVESNNPDTRNPTLGQVIRRFKALVTYYVHAAGRDDFAWQERFYDHVVRINNASIDRIRQYILNNPAKWIEDDLYNV
ncbi:MAG TPA: hypothetical protein VFA41_18500 [Ktedonobacteraceae bacterium]|jgi:REP element-mobilizing transposase RayT|nr:hypothetical protein [Ktedonobacteraceae bacterium]